MEAVCCGDRHETFQAETKMLAILSETRLRCFSMFQESIATKMSRPKPHSWAAYASYVTNANISVPDHLYVITCKTHLGTESNLGHV